MIYFEVGMDEFGRRTMEEFTEDVKYNLKMSYENMHYVDRCLIDTWYANYNNRIRNSFKYKILKFLYVNSSNFRKYVRKFIF
jgi:hypothetical protein